MTVRERSNWPAVTIALMGVVAGVAAISLPFDTPPDAQNYEQARRLRDYARGALFVIALAAPLVSLVVAIVGRALAGFGAGVFALLFVIVWLPGQLRACCGGAESSIIGLLRGINSAQQAYASACAGDKGFASSLEILGRPPAAGGAPFIAPQMTRGLWHGYKVTMIVPEGAAVDFKACDGNQPVSSYFVEAHPLDASSGRRSFATDERGAVYANRDGATIQPGMAGAELSQ